MVFHSVFYQCPGNLIQTTERIETWYVNSIPQGGGGGRGGGQILPTKS